MIKSLPAKTLYQYCDIDQFDFETTTELDDLSEIIGQSRALEAISFGIGIKRDGYNLFVLGPAGMGKQSVVTRLLSQKAATETQPSEWCYVNNFEQPHKPIKLCLPLGWGGRLRRGMDRLVDELTTIIPAIFEGDTYRDRRITRSAIQQPVNELRSEFRDHVDVLVYLDAVEKNISDNIEDFRQGEINNGEMMTLSAYTGTFKRYKVNVIVEHADANGAPVVYEDNPTYQNLIGRIEQISLMGALTTDFTLIKPGALHRANNGYLVLDISKVLQHPSSWDALKHALRASEIRIESPEHMLNPMSTVSLEPEPIPLNLKVVLVGDRTLYYLLHELDPEFKELFKVAADVEDYMPRNPENNLLYARLIATLCRKDKLKPFDKSGVARVIEHSSRIAGDAERLTTHMRSVCDLMYEADYWSGQQGRDVITRQDVQAAINTRVRRNSRMKENIQEAIHRDILLINTAGNTSGQVNALTVIEAGDYAFGTPIRITAQVRMGDGDVVDIEREVDLGGPIHSKGVMILAGYLGAHYAREFPLALSASLVFEQSYGEIEGDSASSAELYALLSALSGAPIRQSLAVTGSVNQYGQIQAIGGVNEKIEGFFDICCARGLTGDQGVIIPQSNMLDLMLREDVITAVKQGQFAVYAVSTADEGIEVLTGIDAGTPDKEGRYPKDSINGRVAHQLLRFAELRHEFGEDKKEPEDENQCSKKNKNIHPHHEDFGL